MYMYVCMLACTYACMHVCMHVLYVTHVCMYVCMYICICVTSGISTFVNMYVTIYSLPLCTCSFHNHLKTTYLNGKVNRRQYEKDAFFRYKRDRQLPPVMTKRTKVEVSHHQRGLQIPTARVHVSETRTVVRCYILFMDTPQEKGGDHGK